ncbi:MAG: tRNA pseudouridine(55) synthase TruB [Nitrospirae bacterium]|nr:MAG: tRNA pseudouridine(55) synthase TruB [Nitrospirota bacterium]
MTVVRSSSIPHPSPGSMVGIDGVLNVNKPEGWTSHDVVAHLRKVLGIRKIGHAGTLDPAATGVLPILIGKGTKIAQYLIDWDKEYHAVLRLGETTDTQDATGSVVSRSSIEHVTESQIRSVGAEFQGVIAQRPPMYSAVKINGRPLYRMARRGQQVERALRTVTIYQLEILQVRGRDVDLRVVCSKGTYVRTLCEDIGERLRVGGHLHRLIRTRVGPCELSNAVDVEALTRQHLLDNTQGAWWSLDAALAEFPELVVTERGEEKIKYGAAVPLSCLRSEFQPTVAQLEHGQLVRLKNARARLLALGKMHIDSHRDEACRVSMVNVFATG